MVLRVTYFWHCHIHLNVDDPIYSSTMISIWISNHLKNIKLYLKIAGVCNHSVQLLSGMCLQTWQCYIILLLLNGSIRQQSCSLMCSSWLAPLEFSQVWPCWLMYIYKRKKDEDLTPFFLSFYQDPPLAPAYTLAVSIAKVSIYSSMLGLFLNLWLHGLSCFFSCRTMPPTPQYWVYSWSAAYQRVCSTIIRYIPSTHVLRHITMLCLD